MPGRVMIEIWNFLGDMKLGVTGIRGKVTLGGILEQDLTRNHLKR